MNYLKKGQYVLFYSGGVTRLGIVVKVRYGKDQAHVRYDICNEAGCVLTHLGRSKHRSSPYILSTPVPEGIKTNLTLTSQGNYRDKSFKPLLSKVSV